MDTQVQVVRAGNLTFEDVGKGLWAPAELDRDSLEWVFGWRQISMISHTTKGVKVRCSKSGHVDHSYKPDERIDITIKRFPDA